MVASARARIIVRHGMELLLWLSWRCCWLFCFWCAGGHGNGRHHGRGQGYWRKQTNKLDQRQVCLVRPSTLPTFQRYLVPFPITNPDSPLRNTMKQIYSCSTCIIIGMGTRGKGEDNCAREDGICVLSGAALSRDEDGRESIRAAEEVMQCVGYVEAVVHKT